MMKRNLLAAAVALACVAPVAQAAPTVYGKVAATWVMTHDDVNGTDHTVRDNASRLGVKGEEAIGSGLTAVYVAEFGLNVDSNDNTKTYEDDDGDEVTTSSGPFSTRNIYVGFQTDYGRFVLGTNDSALKQSQGAVDVFNDLNLDNAEKDTLAVATNGEVRVKNALHYTSPSFGGGLQVLATLPARDENGSEDGLSLAATYTAGKLYAALATDHNLGDEEDRTRLTIGLTDAKFTLGASVEREDGESAFVLSGSCPVGKLTYKASVYKSDIEQRDVQGLLLGLDYNHTKNVRTFAFLGSQEQANDDQAILGAGAELKF